MEFVDPEDGPSPFREPPLPDDRLWRHPSEIEAPPVRPPGPPRAGRNVWVVAGASALVASLVSSAFVLVVVGVPDRGPSRPLALERQMVVPRAASTVVSSPIADIAERVRPAIAQLEIEAGGRSSTASAVMFRSDGHLLTNAHVLEGVTSVIVATASGRKLTGRMIGSDPETDVAVVRVDGGPFPVAILGSAVDLRLGETAIAIGSPMGLAGGPSVTVGVVSALHRQVQSQGGTAGPAGPGGTAGPTLVDMVQTDAPVAPGSSGGALLDANGGVVGIVTAGVSSASGGEATVVPSEPAGSGFAVPIDVARAVADELIRTGKVTHAWLGVQGSDLDGSTATDMAIAGGAMIGQVEGGSPAARGGLATSDVVVAVNGHRVRSMSELAVAVRSSAPGQTLTLEVVRERRHRFMAVTLIERPGAS